MTDEQLREWVRLGEVAADEAKDRGWGATASKIYGGIRSVEWQLRWEERHPDEAS